MRNILAPSGLRRFIEKEYEEYKLSLSKGMPAMAWRNLERAHILGQAYVYEHTKAHSQMLIFALKTKNIKEMLAQLPRLLTGGIKSFAGHIPRGNTGGGNVPPLRAMSIPSDLQDILNKYSSQGGL